MKLYILRHGEAVPAEEVGGRDRDRVLTANGEETSRRAAKGLRRLGIEPAVIWTSPYPRASQTARLTARELDGSPPVEEAEELASGETTARVVEWLAGGAGNKDPVMLVGHNPMLEELVGLLTSTAGDARVELKKGGVAVIEIEPPIAAGRGTLSALWTPKQLSKI